MLTNEFCLQKNQKKKIQTNSNNINDNNNKNNINRIVKKKFKQLQIFEFWNIFFVPFSISIYTIIVLTLMDQTDQQC